MVACHPAINDGIATTSVLLGRQVRQRTNSYVIIAAIVVRDLITVITIAIVAELYGFPQFGSDGNHVESILIACFDVIRYAYSGVLRTHVLLGDYVEALSRRCSLLL